MQDLYLFVGSYVCRVYAADLPSTAAATPSAAAEEAKSKRLQSPIYLTYIVTITIYVTNASIGFLTSTTKRNIPQLNRVFNMFDKE